MDALREGPKGSKSEGRWGSTETHEGRGEPGHDGSTTHTVRVEAVTVGARPTPVPTFRPKLDRRRVTLSGRPDPPYRATPFFALGTRTKLSTSTNRPLGKDYSLRDHEVPEGRLIFRRGSTEGVINLPRPPGRCDAKDYHGKFKRTDDKGAVCHGFPDPGPRVRDPHPRVPGRWGDGRDKRKRSDTGGGPTLR